jgi:hypothetical protein
VTYTYKTGILFTLSDASAADPHEVTLTLKYTVSRGYAATLEEPGEGPSVSLQTATITATPQANGQLRRAYDAPDWLWPFLEGDEALHAELLAHAADDDEYARDQAADGRREERMLEDRR